MNHLDNHNTAAILVLGALGSGKTSFVKWLFNNRRKQLGNFNLLINDVGSEAVDAMRIAQATELPGNDVVALQSGCVCCEDLDSLKESIKELKGKVDTVVIEPTGIAEGPGIVKELQEIGVPARVVTLLDAKHFEKRTLAERMVMETQLAVADVIGVTWWQEAVQEETAKILQFVGENASSAPLFWLEKLTEGPREAWGSQPDQAHHLLTDWLTQEKRKHRHDEDCDHGHGSCKYGDGSSHHGHDHSHEYRHDGVDHHGHSAEAHRHQAPVFPLTLNDLDDVEVAGLEAAIKQFEAVLIRAKGVIAGLSFNYVHGSLNYEDAQPGQKSFLNFITSKPIDMNELKKYFKKPKKPTDSSAQKVYLESRYRPYRGLDKEGVKEYQAMEIRKLIGQYQTWMKLDEEINRLKGVKPLSVNVLEVIEGLKLEQKLLGEAMTFADPLIWLGYKINAYKGGPTELKTLADLRKHCERPDYICHKRLQFLNQTLQKRSGVDLLDEGQIDGRVKLDNLGESELFLVLCMDEDFMKKWQEYEYFRHPDHKGNLQVAKWQNWSSQS